MSTVRQLQFRDLTRLRRELFAIEDAASRSVLSAYSRTRQELIIRVLNWWEQGGAPVSPTELRRLAADASLAREIEGVLGDMEGGLRRDLERGLTRSQANGFEAAERELRLFMRELGIVGRRVSIDRGSVAIIENVLEQVPGIVGATRSALVGELRRGLISGESFAELVRAITQLNLTDRASVFRRGQTSMELFIRRAIIDANNASRNQVYQDSQELVPGLQKQWVSVITPETTQTCLRAHGQIRELDEPYALTGTPRFSDEVMTPPGHWNCRSSSVAYHPDFEVGELTTKTMREAAREALAA